MKRRLRARASRVRGFPVAHGSFDVVVVGGGLAGVCAAVAAARHGAKTALVHDRPVLGGNSSSEIRVNPRGAGMMNPWGRETGIIEELTLEERARNPEGLGMGSTGAVWDMVLYEWVIREPNLTLHLGTLVDEVETRGRTVVAVSGSQHGSETRRRLVGRHFVDATGDGTVGALAGADFRMGREARRQYGESLAPTRADNGTQGSTVLFLARNMGRPVPFAAPVWAEKFDGLNPDRERYVNRFWDVNEAGGLLWIEIGTPYHTIRENDAIRHEILRHVLGVWDYIKNSGRYPKAATYAIVWLGPVPGKRESRRLLGDHVLNQNEVWRAELFPDRVAYGGWWLDVHTVGGILKRNRPIQMRACGRDEDVTVRPYSVPYRSLFSRNVSNLFMAGRDISVTHGALGSTRIMRTCAALGQAAGTAAAMASRYRTTPRGVGARHLAELQQTLVRDDAFILQMPGGDPSDVARFARVTASSAAPLRLPACGAPAPLGGPRAQIVPLSGPRLERLALFVESRLEREIEAEIAVERVTDIWDFRVPGREAARVRAAVPARARGWIPFDCSMDIALPGLYQVTLPMTPGLSVATTEPAAGVSYAWRSGDWKDRWQADKGATIAMLLEPDQRPFEADNVISGVARPEAWTNIWISDPRQSLPQSLTLEWDRPQAFDAVYLTFDTYLNEDHPELPSLWKAPQCVRDYLVEARAGGARKTVAAVVGNYQRRRIHRFRPVRARELRLTVTATNGDPSARVYEVRVCRERRE